MIRRLIVAVILFALITGLVWIYWINVIDPPHAYQPPPLTRSEERILRKAKRYHGTAVMYVEPERIYFERDGKEILILRREA